MATFTYESIVNKFKNVTLSGNLDLLDDSAIIKLGADDDLQITHTGSAATVTNTTGDLTLDLSFDLIVDVDGGDVLLKDAGTQFGAFSNSSGHLLIKDGSTTFLTGAGANATFAGTLATTGILTADAGINVDNITIDGTEIDLSSGDLTVDVAGDIILDAGDGSIILKDDGTQFGKLTNSSGNLILSSGNTTALTFSGANVTIAGTTPSSGNLSTSGTLTVASTSDLNGNVDVAGTITASGDITAFSSEALKDDIRTIDNALNKVTDMRGVYFTKDGEAGTGVIAEEVETVLPEVVKDGKYKSVAYGNIVGVLIEAVKELKEEVTLLKENS